MSVKMYVDLGEKIRLLLAKNGFAVVYDELDYDITFLDFLYNRARVCDVTSLVVITHNMLSDTVYRNSGIAYTTTIDSTRMYSLFSLRDMDKVYAVAKALGISDVRFVDSLGLCCMLGSPEVCYVERVNGMYALCHVKDEKIVDYKLSSSSSLHRSVNAFCVKNGLTKFENVTDIYSSDLLLTFYNIMQLDDTAKNLMMFAFAETEFSKEFSFTRESMAEVFIRLNNTPQPQEIEPVALSISEQEEAAAPQEDLLPTEDLTEGETAKSEKEQRTRANRQLKRELKSGTPRSFDRAVGAPRKGKLTLVLVMLFCFIAVAGFGGIFFLSRQSTAYSDSVSEVKEQIASVQQQNELYEQYLSAEFNGNGLECLTSLGLFDGSAAGVHLDNVSMRKDYVCIVCTCDTQEQADAFVQQASTMYTVDSHEMTGVTGADGVNRVSVSVIFAL